MTTTFYATCSACEKELKVSKLVRKRPARQHAEPSIGFTCTCGNQFRMLEKYCRTSPNQSKQFETFDMKDLYDIRETQRNEAEEDTRDHYNVGLFNGIEFVVAIIEGRNPQFMTTSGNLPSHGYTDILTVKIGVDESTPEAVVSAMQVKVLELACDLDEWKKGLPAIPQHGCFPNDSGTMIFDYKHLYPRTEAVLTSEEVEPPKEPEAVEEEQL